ncbi:MAG TPA: nucleotide disphospho-sugar-binding domain-containing protein [Candidatus Nanopelagicaceae bacterium]|nr:nucleotide disphospho-sugar-binding domain-containing protein [Candidatus Nanopelagicaceae bacterium]
MESPANPANRPLTVLFMPESAYGPTNQCIGIGDLLLKRGHRVVFAAEASWKGKLSALGFEEELVDLAPPASADEEQDAGKFWKDFIKETAPEFRKSTKEQLESFIKPTWQALIDGAKYCQPQLVEILARVKPDVVVEDNVLCFPALMTCDAPFVRIVSCNPLEMKGDGVAPTFSGLPAADSTQWAGFKVEYERTHRDLWQDFNAWVLEQGAPSLPDLEFIHESESANLYVFPEQADYSNQRPLNSTWHRMDSSVRSTDSSFEMPALIADRPSDSGLVYLSLGSLGSADVELMQRLVAVLGRTRHRYIVSTGPQHNEIELASNMYGAEFLPQTRIIPLVDLVITHGGNNTTTEAFHFGKPMIVLPLFWDQYDNAQRVDELGFGVRLDTYNFSDDELIAAVDRLVSNPEIRKRMHDVGTVIRTRDGIRKGVDVIESVARVHANKSEV